MTTRENDVEAGTFDFEALKAELAALDERGGGAPPNDPGFADWLDERLNWLSWHCGLRLASDKRGYTLYPHQWVDTVGRPIPEDAMPQLIVDRWRRMAPPKRGRRQR